jgi:hypothetical protein
MTEQVKYTRAYYHIDYPGWLNLWSEDDSEPSKVVYEGSIYSLSYDKEDGYVKIITSTETLLVDVNDNSEIALELFMNRLNTPDEELKDVPSDLEIVARPLNNSKALH